MQNQSFWFHIREIENTRATWTYKLYSKILAKSSRRVLCKRAGVASFTKTYRNSRLKYIQNDIVGVCHPIPRKPTQQCPLWCLLWRGSTDTVYSFCRHLFRKEPHEGKTVTAHALRITGDITSDITGDITSSVILREQNVVWSAAVA